ncbi:endo-1,3-beta-glucosidase [Phaeodactylum tricornutum CCAP 1055/1]|uniref:glucan endo-1,3-beta-D-glucosidase n=2 Tax=Phaeodactylum tricornutum TaxID=2850 RepID=B7G207_PHATC|nr:endo-1,3-beta-glucosidase [Phaeodactylum tricornutum CCAP 1055/1]EEC47217.1 endo-1,3-beta-glucosidase [Phaeodactylum tricornutum CCAP 1055/1]|eukprot:XP_002181294.1 endo-1,3-beta-glucosidase [Phaeodactylum tricornutum CCAP 1055/1]
METPDSKSGAANQRPQYHYFYGSIDDQSQVNRRENAVSVPTDQDSLVGESLLPTDNEQDDDRSKIAKQDFQQIVMSNVNGVRPIDSSRSERMEPKSCLRFFSINNLRRQHPMGYLLLSVGSLTLLAFLCSVIFFSKGQSGRVIRTPKEELSFRMPFPWVDRAQYGDPVSKVLDKDLFHPSLVYKGKDPSRVFIFPFPTGAFWTNLVLPTTADRGLSYPIVVYPYAYKWSKELLQVSYPASHRRELPKEIHDDFFPDLTFASVESTSQRHITAFDPLSVTVQYSTMNGGTWESYLVQGSPYVTLRYDNVTPKIRALSIFKTSSAFKGVIRLAYIPPSVSKPSNNVIDVTKSTGLQRLIYHAGVYPISGEVSWSFRTSAHNSALSAATKSLNFLSGAKGTNAASESAVKSVLSSSSSPGCIGTIQFDFGVKAFAPATSASAADSLLMLALPHHAQSLLSSVQLPDETFDLAYKCIKGTMTPILGSSWVYDENLPSLGFDGDTGSNSNKAYLDLNIRSTLIESLEKDMNLALPTLTENIYGFGKQIARLSQLAHIADVLRTGGVEVDENTNVMNNSKLFESQEKRLDLIFNGTLSLLTSRLQQFLTSNISDSLVYDTNFGGMVSVDGLRDSNRDFGNGRYNDHHFHYGYILYACAVLGRLDRSFILKYGDKVDATTFLRKPYPLFVPFSIFYDIAHDSNSASQTGNGAFFPLARHKSWFDGHSFASGLFPFGNGKSQESSSEAVNGYYGAYLWSLVRHKEAETPNEIIRLLKITWSETLECLTSYAQLGSLFSRKYVTEEYTNILNGLGEVEMAWRGFVVGDHAIMDPQAAWEEAQGVFSAELDAGLSKSQLLFWIANRKGFSPSMITLSAVEKKSEASTIVHDRFIKYSSCLNYDSCRNGGLSGNCCPTDDGLILDCCNI